MQVLELVVQGVRFFAEQRRITFGPAVTVVQDPKDSQGQRLQVLAEALRGLLTFDPAKSYAEKIVDAAQKINRVGATIKGRDGQTYRLIHDLKSGTYALHRASLQGNGFEAVTSKPAEVSRYLRTELGFPPEEVWARIFASPSSGLPSKRPTALMAGMMPGLMPGLMPGMVPGVPMLTPVGSPGMVGGPATLAGLTAAPSGAGAQGVMTMMGAVMTHPLTGVPARTNSSMPAAPAPPNRGGVNFAHLPTAEKERRFQQVKEALQSLRQQQALEYELDGVQRRRYELDELLQPLHSRERELAAAVETLKPFEAMDRLPTDIRKQLDHYQRQKTALTEELRKADVASAQAREKELALTVPPFHSDLMFQAGLAGGLLAVVGGFVGALILDMPTARYLGLLDLVGFAVAALSLTRHFNALEAHSAAVGRGNMADDRKQRGQRKFDLESSNVRRVLTEFSVGDDRELESFRERISARDDARLKVAERQRAVEELRAQLGTDAVGDERAQLAAQQTELEARLHTIAFTGNEKDLLEEQRALAAELGITVDEEEDDYGHGYGRGSPGGGVRGSRLSGSLEPSVGGEPMDCAPDPAGASLPGMPGMPSGFGFPPGFGALSGAPDAIVNMMKLATDVFHVPVAELGHTIQARAAQYLNALSDKRFAQVSYTDAGDAALVESTGKVIPYATLVPQDQDLVYLSTQMTLIETHLRKCPCPVVIDAWFVGLPDVKHPLLCKMVQFMGTLGQVIHITPRATLAACAEQSVSL
jgi:hypothetical protein